MTAKLTLAIIFFTALGLFIAFAGGVGGVQFGGVSVFLLCGILAYIINWIAFIPAVIYKTEKYYDAVGSLTFLSMLCVGVLLSTPLHARAIIVALMVGIWAVRLGSFLFLRIRRDGHDRRFATLKTFPLRFFLTWTLQATWAILTSACALAIITSLQPKDIGLIGYCGIFIWGIGFLIEVVSDRQKSDFRKDPANSDKFINSGLWAWSRHPNYFGEITLWVGIAIMALPILIDWQWAVLVSPFFVMFLLVKVSGIPMLEKHAAKKWGDNNDYKAYCAVTPVLVLKPPKAENTG